MLAHEGRQPRAAAGRHVVRAVIPCGCGRILRLVYRWEILCGSRGAVRITRIGDRRHDGGRLVAPGRAPVRRGRRRLWRREVLRGLDGRGRSRGLRRDVLRRLGIGRGRLLSELSEVCVGSACCTWDGCCGGMYCVGWVCAADGCCCGMYCVGSAVGAGAAGCGGMYCVGCCGAPRYWVGAASPRYCVCCACHASPGSPASEPLSGRQGSPLTGRPSFVLVHGHRVSVSEAF